MSIDLGRSGAVGQDGFVPDSVKVTPEPVVPDSQTATVPAHVEVDPAPAPQPAAAPAGVGRSARAAWAASWKSLFISMVLIAALVVVVVVVTPRPGNVELPTVAAQVKADDMAGRLGIPVALLVGAPQWRATSVEGKATEGSPTALWRVGYHKSGATNPAYVGIEQFRGRDSAEAQGWLEGRGVTPGGESVSLGGRTWRVQGGQEQWVAAAEQPLSGLTTVVRGKGVQRGEFMELVGQIAPVKGASGQPRPAL